MMRARARVCLCVCVRVHVRARLCQSPCACVRYTPACGWGARLRPHVLLLLLHASALAHASVHISAPCVHMPTCGEEHMSARARAVAPAR
eukprot:12559753-Alexandrium_andersonii.AAC.1